MKLPLPSRIPILYLILIVLIAVGVVPIYFYAQKMVTHNRETLGRMSADNIRFALTQGTMRTQASSLSPAQIDAVVRFLAASATASSPTTANTCPAAPPASDPLSAPHWNG